jgi:nitroreductase
LDRDVPQEKVNRILDLASRYPSAGHTEPQELVVVRERQVKEDLARAALEQMFVVQAPLVIVVVSDVRRSARRYGGEASTSLASPTEPSLQCSRCLQWWMRA